MVFKNGSKKLNFILFGHAKYKFDDAKPLITSRLGSLGFRGLMDHVHFRFKRPNTFSAVHHGLNLALTEAGYNIGWTEKIEDLDKKAVIFTEAKYIPILGDLSKYYKIILHAEPTDYEEIIRDNKNVFFWENYKGNLGKENWERIAPLTFFNSKIRSIQMPWATDAMAKNSSSIKAESNTTYYVGNFSTDALEKAKELRCKNFKFLRVGGVNFEKAKEFVLRSEFTFDVRNSHTIKLGFIPCRIFKNFSYGRMCFTNSRHISECFSIPSYNNLPELLSNIEEFRKGSFNDLIKHLQNEMLHKHSYRNRLQTLKSIVGF